MLKPIVGTCAVLLGMLLLGCLEFDEQTVYVEHDRENDRLLLIINYRGLYAEEPDVMQAQSQLQEALENETVALLGNWPFAFPLREMREDLREPDPEALHEMPEEVRLGLLRLLERIKVLNGGFYTDPAGRVCGAQVVVIENIADTVGLANDVINAAVLADLEDYETDNSDDAAAARLALEYARRGESWIELKGHSLVASFPLPERDLIEGRRDIAEGLTDPDDMDAELYLRVLRDLFESPILVWHEDDLLKVKCGYVSEPSVFTAKPRRGEYEPNLVEHITETYGLHLDANLARFLADPDASAETDAERAARLMAPRLAQRERVRVLVHRLTTDPADEYWAKLREERLPPGELAQPADLADQELLERWEEWLRRTAEAAERAAVDEPQLAPPPGG